ncbi:cytochrome c biogenesis protein CcdC [Halobacillus yeomjeoni]|uniref:Cytochrome c biogenesis protein CcdC n=1 Tax=Halobacillus yeomjeoni TaxID=311194 RepID=A0A931HUE9_9BACI|nr:cytochrome c biogenesis protein CcdC [Halobacillus yeomjeoni]MBH0229406.1 cytochrome c biogenesis protein CcdC [Halobacillus yeomjeoni]MCA0983189.1 cytochrome c biogenesis protein CcdC [Halobacillus yeomjeoni]
MFWLIISTIGAACMATGMIFLRLRAAKRPASVRKIILPPMFMSTGALMFVIPMFRVEWIQVLEAFSVGVLFSFLLIRTSKFEVRGDHIYLKPSRAFIFILFGLLILRIVLKLVIGQTVSFGETSGMFFLLAFGMILTWRIAMLKQFLQLEKKLQRKKDLA